MPGLPDDAFDLLVRTLARICDDPYDRLFSLPSGKDPSERMGELGDSGFIVSPWTTVLSWSAFTAWSGSADPCCRAGVRSTRPPGSVRRSWRRR
jgi:hypothetical protein